MKEHSLKKIIEWANKTPKFSELEIRNSFQNLTHAEYVNAPIFGSLDILMQAALARLLSSYLKYFLEKHKKDTSFI